MIFMNLLAIRKFYIYKIPNWLFDIKIVCLIHQSSVSQNVNILKCKINYCKI